MSSVNPPAAYPLASGAVVDRKYAVERVLGEGGMGVVYLARDLLTETHVVLKAIRSAYASRAEYRDRILTEGRALAKIDHPNVVRLNAIVVEENALYLVMQYIEGESVEDLIQRHTSEGRPVALAEAVRIVSLAAQGVAAAHREGIIHRDIKPANILVRARDGAIKVTDFGIAKAEEDAKLGRGKTRGVIGSAPYMAPEQCTGKVIDKRVDIYSLGVVFYELLTGRLPFESESAVETMMQHVNEDVPSILPLRPDVPPELDAVLRRACARKPEDRYASGEDLVAALDRATGSDAAHAHVAAPRVSAPSPAVTPPASKRRSSTLRLGLLFGAVGGLGVLGAFALGLFGNPADPEKKPAPPPAKSSAPPAGAASSAALSIPEPDLTGSWTSDSGRAYDVVFRDGAFEFRIRDVAQFPEQGYEAGEARFRLRPITDEMETYLVEDRIRPFPPDGTHYDLQKSRESCVEVWTEMGGRPLRAQLDGKRLWVRMARLEPTASNFNRQGSLVVGCAGLREARVSEVDSFLTRTK